MNTHYFASSTFNLSHGPLRRSSFTPSVSTTTNLPSSWVAPRPVYIASATEDLWADPKGEFLGGKLANPVYALYGEKGLAEEAPPPPDTSVGDFIGYHARTGKHNILLFDWQQYMNFADRHWGKPQ